MNDLYIARESSYATPFSSSPLLPLLLLSLLQQKHSPKTTETFKKQYDYIIVGAGSAGSTVASRLSERPCVRVLLLEAGGALPLLSEVPALTLLDSDIDWSYKTVPQKNTARLHKNRQMNWHSGKTIGGTSVINAELVVRGNRRNYNKWAELGAEGWSYQDVLPYFKKLEDNNDEKLLQNSPFHGSAGPVSVEDSSYNSIFKKAVFTSAADQGYPLVDPNAAEETGTARNGQRCSTAKAYLVPAENRANLNIVPNAYVTKILIENFKAVGVEVDIKGQRRRLSARREVIISAGTVRTPQLLMLSGIGPTEELQKHDISVLMDLPVGKNLQDHVSARSYFELDPNITNVEDKLKNPENANEYISHRKGIFSSFDVVSAVAFLNNDVHPESKIPDVEIYFAEATVKGIIAEGLTDEAYDKAYKPYENRTIYRCDAQILHPKSRGSIQLQSSNPFDQLIINPNYYDVSNDLQDVVEGMKICYKFSNSSALQLLGSKPLNISLPGCEKFIIHSENYLRCQAQSVTTSTYNGVGTSKMGDPADPTTVVDPQLRVKGIRGLRVVDASVMPTIPSGNINIPTIMIGEKASDIIKGTIRCPLIQILK